jgi:hypothetical protein
MNVLFNTSTLKLNAPILSQHSHLEDTDNRLAVASVVLSDTDLPSLAEVLVLSRLGNTQHEVKFLEKRGGKLSHRLLILSVLW